MCTICLVLFNRVASSCEFFMRKFLCFARDFCLSSQKSLFLDAGHWKCIESLCMCHENVSILIKAVRWPGIQERVLCAICEYNAHLFGTVSVFRSQTANNNLSNWLYVKPSSHVIHWGNKAEYALGATLHVIISITKQPLTEQLRWNVFFFYPPLLHLTWSSFTFSFPSLARLLDGGSRDSVVSPHEHIRMPAKTVSVLNPFTVGLVLWCRLQLIFWGSVL